VFFGDLDTMMNEQQRRAVFAAQTINVRDLERAWKQLNRQVNDLIRQNRKPALEVSTKLLALIYCALAEAVFSKLIHTPHSFSLSEIEQIKSIAKGDGVKAGWVKATELAVKAVGGKANHAPNVLKKVKELIDQYIYDPSLVRNKLAHGQWSVALNRENTAVNDDISEEIASHSVVELARRKFALEKLAAIVEDLVESPDKAHHRDYWPHVVELETGLAEMKSWTLESRAMLLARKPKPRPA
jgi:hypothetical protein